MVRYGAGLALAAALALAGCGTTGQPPADPARESGESTTSPSDGIPAPSLTVSAGDARVDLRPWTSCWQSGGEGMCADGAPPQDPPSLGEVDQPLTVSFPVTGWTWTATTRAPGSTMCAPTLPMTVTPGADGTARLDLTGPPGRAHVDISGRGPEGDFHTTVEIETTSLHPIAAPTTLLSLFAEQDGGTLKMGPAMVTARPLSPGLTDSASGSLTITAADGTRTVIPLMRAGEAECPSPGTLVLVEEVDEGEQDVAGRYGPEPYSIEVDLDIGDQTFTARSTWPTDEEPSPEQQVVLVMDPPLPTADPEEFGGLLSSS